MLKFGGSSYLSSALELLGDESTSTEVKGSEDTNGVSDYSETLLNPTAVDEAYDHLSANYLHHKGGASEPWSLYFEGVAPEEQHASLICSRRNACKLVCNRD